MCAAYKGKTEMCELLLAQGADINSNNHEHQYTALMFACLSGMYKYIYMYVIGRLGGPYREGL